MTVIISGQLKAVIEPLELSSHTFQPEKAESEQGFNSEQAKAKKAAESARHTDTIISLNDTAQETKPAPKAIEATSGSVVTLFKNFATRVREWFFGPSAPQATPAANTDGENGTGGLNRPKLEAPGVPLSRDTMRQMTSHMQWVNTLHAKGIDELVEQLKKPTQPFTEASFSRIFGELVSNQRKIKDNSILGHQAETLDHQEENKKLQSERKVLIEKVTSHSRYASVFGKIGVGAGVVALVVPLLGFAAVTGTLAAALTLTKVIVGLTGAISSGVSAGFQHQANKTQAKSIEISGLQTHLSGLTKDSHGKMKTALSEVAKLFSLWRNMLENEREASRSN